MAIAIENMVGYLRTRPSQDGPGKLEIYVDQNAVFKGGPVPSLTLPPDCCGVLYSVPETGRLEVRYPDE